VNRNIKFCVDCEHCVFPPVSLGECHAPGVPDGTLLMHCRAAAGACGLDGTLYVEKKHDRDS